MTETPKKPMAQVAYEAVTQAAQSQGLSRIGLRPWSALARQEQQVWYSMLHAIADETLARCEENDRRLAERGRELARQHFAKQSA